MNEPSGTLYGVGVGPGSPDLITLQAFRILQRVPVVAFPAPSDGHSLTKSIAETHVHPDATLLALRMPIDSLTFNPDIYKRWKELLSPLLLAGKDVAVLCEGDPMLYGSFQYIMALLADSHPVVIAPGITSVSAAAASLCLPLCSYQSHLHVLSATDSVENFHAILQRPDAFAILKVGKRFPRIKALLSEYHKLDLAYVVSYASWQNQSSTSVAALADDTILPYFSIILVKAP